MSTVRIAVLAGILLAGQAFAARVPDIGAAAAKLAAHSDGFYLDRKPGAVEALNGLWRTVQDWTADYLNAHPGATAEALTAAVPKGRLAVKATALGSGAFVVTVQRGEIGNVFLVARDDHGGAPHFAKLWDIRDSEAKPEGWRAEAAQSQCDGCRALSGKVQVLAADMSGRRRFVVDAAFAQPGGATHGKELSIWSFSGKSVRPMYKKTYVAVQDDGWETKVSGNIVTVPVKGEYRMLAACGACDGRKLLWTLKVGYDLVVDAGQIPVVPNMDMVDEVLLRVWNNQPADALATPQVIKTMQRIVDAVRQTADPGDPKLGMLSAVTLARHGEATEMTVETDIQTLPTMRFTVIQKNGAPYLNHVMNPNGG